MGKCQRDVFMDIDVLAHIFYYQVITELKGQLQMARNTSIRKLLPFFWPSKVPRGKIITAWHDFYKSKESQSTWLQACKIGMMRFTLYY